MAALAGRSVHTRISELEIVSEDEQNVLRIQHTSDGGTTLMARKAWDSRWESFASWSIKQGDVSVVAAAITGSDVSWDRTSIDAISATSFKRDAPDNVEKAVEEALNAEKGRCSELDIERARAANLVEQRDILRVQMLVDHANDKHIHAAYEGCPKCEDNMALATPRGFDDVLSLDTRGAA